MESVCIWYHCFGSISILNTQITCLFEIAKGRLRGMDQRNGEGTDGDCLEDSQWEWTVTVVVSEN